MKKSNLQFMNGGKLPETGTTLQWRQSGLKSGGSWIRVKKISIFPGKFPKIFDFFRQFLTNIPFFPGELSKNFDFFRAISQKILIFQAKLLIYSYLLANYSISLQSHNFRTYVLYMISYNNDISRPAQNPHDPPPKI